jgi:hypothetical protein
MSLDISHFKCLNRLGASMKALRAFAKKLFSFRKIVWLFLCSMLMIAGEAGAQVGDQGNKQPTGGNGTAITQPVPKYGPPPAPAYGPPPPHWKVPIVKPQPPVVVKYGPPSSFKPEP